MNKQKNYLSLGEMQAIMRVLELPPRLSCSRRVSLLSLKSSKIIKALPF